MKVYRNINKNLYSIEQRGEGMCITPHPKAHYWYAIPFKTNRDAEVIEIGPDLDLSKFKLAFEI